MVGYTGFFISTNRSFLKKIMEIRNSKTFVNQDEFNNSADNSIACLFYLIHCTGDRRLTSHCIYLYRMHNLAALSKCTTVRVSLLHMLIRIACSVSQQLSKLPPSAVTGSDSTVVS